MSNRLSLINNVEYKQSFENHLISLFKNSSQINIAVAFLKSSGLDLVEKVLKTALKRGTRINLIVGLDFGFSEYAALHKLLQTFEKYDSSKLYFAQGTRGVFHPKFYLLSNRKTATIIVGSSNFTKGGFSENMECSLRVECALNSKLYKDSLKYFNDLLNSHNEVFEASFLTLEKYKPFQKSQTDIRNKKLQQKPNQTDDDELLELNTKKLIKQYESYFSKGQNKSDLLKRRRNYPIAKHLLDKISRIKDINTTNFYPLYAELVGGAGYEQIWHSGGLNRGISKVKKHPKKFQELVRYIKKNSHRPVDEVFESAMIISDRIPKLGINAVTEILATYNSQKFAIVNNSPIDSLNYFGVYVKSKKSFNGIYYSIFCRWMYEIQKMVNAKSLLEIDGFFNYIYWRRKERQNNV